MKTKFSTKKCAKCIYRGVVTGGSATSKRYYCNYSSITGTTCLKRISADTIIDIRCNDYNGCKLYTRGKQIIPDNHPVIVGGNHEN